MHEHTDFNLDEIEKDFRRLFARRLDRMGRLSVERARELTPRDTGASAQSLEYEVDEARSRMRFGSVLLRFRMIELGTRTQTPRAPLRQTAEQLAPQYRNITRG